MPSCWILSFKFTSSKKVRQAHFDPTVPLQEREHRRKQFEALTGRQQGQKGTLLYDAGSTQTVCYFASAPHGKTCATTGKIRVKGSTSVSPAVLVRVLRAGLPCCDKPGEGVCQEGNDQVY